jgi:hypothetical protein
VKKNAVRQDGLDNLADALTEDILNTPDDELLREVEEDYGDPRALANKFDQILERTEKQVFGTAGSATSPQVRSSVLDLPISLPDEMIRWAKGIGSRLSEFLSSLRPRTLAWSATAAAVVILVQAAVITAVLVKEQGAPSGPSLARSLERKADPLPRAGVPEPDVAIQPPLLGSSGTMAALTRSSETPLGFGPSVAAQSPPPASPPERKPALKLSDEEIAALVAGGHQLIVAGDIPKARLVLQQAAEAGNATAALELGATYDPTILQTQKAPVQTQKAPVQVGVPRTSMIDMGDVRMARLWYEKAKDLGSTEAAVRLERLRSVNPRR